MIRDVQKPYPTEHSCRLKRGDYTRHARDTCQRKVNGKCVDVILGIKEGKSEAVSLRFKSSIWTTQAAASYCRSQGGTFEAAKRPTVKGVYFRLAAPGRSSGDFSAPTILSYTLDDDDTVRVLVGKLRCDLTLGAAMSFLFRKDAWTEAAAKEVLGECARRVDAEIRKGFKPKLLET